MTIVMNGHPDRIQFKLGCRCDQVETGLALETDRLQGERVAAADQAVGADADTDCRSGGHPAIDARQCARSYARSRRENDPSQSDVIAEADLRADAVNGGLIVLSRAPSARGENAIERLIRYDDVACRS